MTLGKSSVVGLLFSISLLNYLGTLSVAAPFGREEPVL